MITLTIWLCLASQPHCAIADDPTGPPITREFASKTQCENFAKTLFRFTPAPPQYTPRFTCTPQGTDI